MHAGDSDPAPLRRLRDVQDAPDLRRIIPLVGNRAMDGLHVQLGALLVHLQGALEHRKMAAAMQHAVTLLMQLRAEYAAEEALMGRYGYAQLRTHQAAHVELERDFGALSRAIRDAGADPRGDAHSALLALLFDGARKLGAHIECADLPLADFLRSATSAPE